jgi:hypothetical protein
MLNTVNNLGVLYANQDKIVEVEAEAEAEAMYLRALQGYENAVGADCLRTRLIARLNALELGRLGYLARWQLPRAC